MTALTKLYGAVRDALYGFAARVLYALGGDMGEGWGE